MQKSSLPHLESWEYPELQTIQQRTVEQLQDIRSCIRQCLDFWIASSEQQQHSSEGILSMLPVSYMPMLSNLSCSSNSEVYDEFMDYY